MKRVTGNAIQYWRHPFFVIRYDLMELSPTTKLILTAVLSSNAALFQSAGGYAPGIGFFVSAMTTLPLFLATVISVRYGFLSYLVTILLLVFIQPSELFIFSFTTGILGLVIGASFRKTRFFVVFSAGAGLFMGVIALLFVFRFPVLGPGVGASFDFILLLLVAVFSFVYAWIAAVACSILLKRVVHVLPDRVIKPVSGQQEVNNQYRKKL